MSGEIETGPPVFTTQDTRNWLDAWELTTEVIAEHWSKPKLMKDITGLQGEIPAFDVNRYRVFRASVIKVKQIFIDMGLNLGDHLNVEGLMPTQGGDLIPVGPVKVYPSDKAVIPIEFQNMDAGVVAHLLTWYTAASNQTRDPQAYVRRVLSKQGITDWKSFEANKSKMLIENPFPKPTDEE